MEYVTAIVGRPNVGKSTLFNRLVGGQPAIVHPTSGVTRDRNYGEVEWTGKKFFLIDTGGFVPDSQERFEKAIRQQVQLAIEEADTILFVVDSKTGIHPSDSVIAEMLRKSAEGKRIILVANKVDTVDKESSMFEFYSLGLGDPFPLSAINGFNSGDLLDLITKDIPEDDSGKQDHIIKFAIIGKPNAGKSSIANALLNEERNIVTEIPGTTRDTIDSTLKYHGEDIILIDTAGLRKKSKVRESIEFYSTIRTYKAIERCNVALLVIDAAELLEQAETSTDLKSSVFKFDKQDTKIIEEVMRLKKGLLIVSTSGTLLKKIQTLPLLLKRNSTIILRATRFFLTYSSPRSQNSAFTKSSRPLKRSTTSETVRSRQASLMKKCRSV